MPCHTPDIYQFETVPEQKKFLRKRAKTFLREYTADKELMKQCALSALKSVTESDVYKNASFVFGFMPMKDELDISLVMEQALKDGKKLLLPRMHSDSNEMDFYFVDSLSEASDDDNSFSIKEPSVSCRKLEISEIPGSALVFVPGLAFNLEGQRLGRGKGFYDRFLSLLPSDKNISLCGVCFTICVTKAIPVEPNDRPVTHLLTEYGLVKAVTCID